MVAMWRSWMKCLNYQIYIISTIKYLCTNKNNMNGYIVSACRSTLCSQWEIHRHKVVLLRNLLMNFHGISFEGVFGREPMDTIRSLFYFGNHSNFMAPFLNPSKNHWYKCFMSSLATYPPLKKKSRPYDQGLLIIGFPIKPLFLKRVH